MYYHGLERDCTQTTRVAASRDGLRFGGSRPASSEPYLRVFVLGGGHFGVTLAGKLVASPDGGMSFGGPRPFGPTRESPRGDFRPRGRALPGLQPDRRRARAAAHVADRSARETGGTGVWRRPRSSCVQRRIGKAAICRSNRHAWGRPMRLPTSCATPACSATRAGSGSTMPVPARSGSRLRGSFPPETETLEGALFRALFHVGRPVARADASRAGPIRIRQKWKALLISRWVARLMGRLSWDRCRDARSCKFCKALRSVSRIDRARSFQVARSIDGTVRKRDGVKA